MIQAPSEKPAASRTAGGTFDVVTHCGGLLGDNTILRINPLSSPAATTIIFTIKTSELIYEQARVMNNKEPQTKAKNTPKAAVFIKTCKSGSNGTLGHMPSNLRSIGSMPPNKSAIPIICPVLIAGYTQSEPRKRSAVVDASRKAQKGSNM